MIGKSIDLSIPIQPLLAERYSGVCYDPARPVSESDLRALAEAARWSPSCFGDQPWRYLICSKPHKPAAWDKAFAALNEKNQQWCQHAPVLVVVCHDTLFVHNDKPNMHAAYDTGAASMSLCVQATALGLMTHQMAGFSADKARELFAIPERYTPIAMMSVGYQLPEENLPEQYRERELKPRARSPLDSRFFGGEWGEGL
jgi:nitroreductase